MIGAITAGLFSTGAAAGGGTSYDSIATSTVTSGAPTSISFSSIPSTYKHLQVRILAAKGGTTDWVEMTLNSDTGANYSTHRLYGNGTSAAASASTSATKIISIVANNSTSTFSAGIIDILDYQNTNKNKTVRGLTGFDANGSGEIYLSSGAWYSTSAVNTLTFITASGTGFSNGTKFALYGIKG